MTIVRVLHVTQVSSERYSLAAHLSRALQPVWSPRAVKPGSQGEQEAEDDEATRSGSHAKHVSDVVAPSVDEYLPTGQPEHDDAPVENK